MYAAVPRKIPEHDSLLIFKRGHIEALKNSLFVVVVKSQPLLCSIDNTVGFASVKKNYWMLERIGASSSEMNTSNKRPSESWGLVCDKKMLLR